MAEKSAANYDLSAPPGSEKIAAPVLPYKPRDPQNYHPNIGLIAVLAYGGHLVLDGEMTVGTLISFNIYVMLLIQPLREAK